METAQCLKQVQENIRGGIFVNEAAVTNGAVLPILQALGWDIFDTRVVSPQYLVEGRRVDLALCCAPGKPVVLIEVKQPGREEGADRQLFEYAFLQGVPMVVLTNGQEWNIYLPAEQGNYQERQLCKLDLLERDPTELDRDLTRYLSYTDVKSGEALANARKDYRSVSRIRESKRMLPVAWHRLIQEQDSLLIDLLAEKVESLCGYRPDLDTVATFLLEQGRRPPPPPPGLPPPVAGRGFRLKEQEAQARSAIDVLVHVLERLSSDDSQFLARFASRPRHGRTRRFVARNKEELYPNRPDLVLNYSHQLSSGWWVGTNYSKHQIEQILRMAAEVGGLTFGDDLVVWLG